MLDKRFRKNQFSRAVMIDRDGTINRDLGYTHRVEDLVFLEGALAGLKLLTLLDIHIIIVTNQSGIALGIYARKTMRQFHEKMVRSVEQEGGRIDAIYFAPHFDLNSLPPGYELHHSSKPNPGMLEKAALDFMIDIHRSWMVGDRITDIVAGKVYFIKEITKRL
jgi:histidinol-phosphate phosphatase family protein